MLIPESIFAAILALLGVIQVMLAYKATHRVQHTLRQTTSPLHRMAVNREIWRPVYGLLWLAFLSFLLAALSIVIPLYLSKRLEL